MKRDIRESALYREAEALYSTVRRPGTGQISDASEIHVASDGRSAVFTAAMVEALVGSPLSRVGRVDLDSGETRVLTFGPNTDRCPKYSPDAAQIAFLSDRHRAGDFQLYLLDAGRGAARATARVDGWAEYLEWSPDGRRILLGVAGHGADVAGAQGAITSKGEGEAVPSWMPSVEGGEEAHRWRRVWVYELDGDRVRVVSAVGSNVWEATWCGNSSIAAIVSPGPREGLWYSATLQLLDLDAGGGRGIFSAADQLGLPSSSPSGRHVAVVEALSSDRGLVAGDVRVIDTASGEVRRIDTGGVDVTHTEWQSDRHLLLAGHRGFESVVGHYDLESSTFVEGWAGRDVTGVGRYLVVSGAGATAIGDCAFVGESFVRAPEIGVIRGGEYREVKSFDLGYGEAARVIDRVECVEWSATDGLTIQGWLIVPRGRAPFPLIMNVHGGPVWHWRPACLARARSLPLLMLLKRGYAIFCPNPRGSSGRGQDFARRVKGDMNGADTQDFLSGLDHLVATGMADGRRVGVTGVSYGGGMSSWLITQDSRFAAAVPISPHTNQVTERLLSNIPDFVDLFLDDRFDNPGGKYFTRSPVMFAHRVKTPTLNMCGALDRCTPPEEAMQFHQALLGNGVESVLLTYPEEGHGVQKWPAAMDYAARVVDWFETHMGQA
jgi:dipeptidyl aminopeptidase/acylaminoacyl peptidase